MLPRKLQFQFTSDQRTTVFVFLNQLHCIRQTARTLEFLHCTPNGTFRVIIVTGSNLGLLRRAVLAGTVHVLTPGPYPPDKAGVAIHSIVESSGWSLPKETMPPDPNPVARHCLQFETGLVRDLWSHAHLDYFAVPRGREEKFLFQFRENYSYILTAMTCTFSGILAEFKRSNLDPGMINKFTAIADALPRLPGVCHDRVRFKEITFNHRNHAAEAAWNVVMDFRPRIPPPRMGMAI
jgi:hypothetical protein